MGWSREKIVLFAVSSFCTQKRLSLHWHILIYVYKNNLLFIAISYKSEIEVVKKGSMNLGKKCSWVSKNAKITADFKSIE